MSKSPKNPSQRNDLKRRKDEGGAPRSKPTRKPRSSPKRKAENVLDSVSAEIPSHRTDAPHGSTVSSHPPAQNDSLFEDGKLIAHGIKAGEDQQHSHGEIRDEAKHPVQPVAVTDVPTPKEPDQSVTNDLHQSNDGVRMRADQK